MRLVYRLPDHARLDMTWQPTEVWLLTIRPRWSSARSYEFVVPDRRRRIICWLLRCLPGLNIGWHRIEAVEFGSSAARRAFEALI